MLRSGSARLRKASVALVALILIATVIWGSALGSIYFKRDSRILLSDWMEVNAKDGDVVAIEEFETLLPMPGRTETVVLPLLAEDSPDRETELVTALARADWIVVGSKRRSGTLPRLLKHDLVCAYYLALARGDLGFDAVALFERPPGFKSLQIPLRYGEETLSAFDHPRVRVYQNVTHLSQAEIEQRLRSEDVGACSKLRIGGDILDLPRVADR
jgi:hypothetical protein